MHPRFGVKERVALLTDRFALETMLEQCDALEADPPFLGYTH